MTGTNCFLRPRGRLKAIAALCLCLFATELSAQASSFYGLDLNDLPRDGDVTIPGDYPIMVRRKGSVLLSSLTNNLAINIVSPSTQAAVVQISSPTEKRTRTLRILAGAPTTYVPQNSKEVTLRVTDGDVTITSMHPLKVQHPMIKNLPVQK